MHSHRPGKQYVVGRRKSRQTFHKNTLQLHGASRSFAHLTVCWPQPCKHSPNLKSKLLHFRSLSFGSRRDPKGPSWGPNSLGFGQDGLQPCLIVQHDSTKDLLAHSRKLKELVRLCYWDHSNIPKEHGNHYVIGIIATYLAT